MRIYYLLLCLTFFCYISNKAQAQNAASSYSVSHYNVDNSIIQNSTWAMDFDRQGYGWIGTESGIIRYDGKNFKFFDKSNIAGLRSSTFTSVVSDKKGILYSKDDFGSIIKIRDDNNRASYAETDTSDDFLIGRKGWVYKRSNYNKLLNNFGDTTVEKTIKANRQCIAINDSTAYFYNGISLWYVCGSSGTALRLNSPMGVIDGVLLNVSLLGDTLISIHGNNTVECFYQGGKVNSVTHLTGDITTDTAFLNNNFRVLWCRAGTFIYADSKLYQLFFIGNSLHSLLLFSGLPVLSPVAICYNPYLNLYFLLTNNDGIFVVKKAIFSVYLVPDDNRYNNAYFTIAEMPGNLIAANNLIFDSVGNYRSFYLTDTRLRLLYNDNDKGFWYSYKDSLKYFSFASQKNITGLKFKQTVSSYCLNPFDSVLYFSSGFSIFKFPENSSEPKFVFEGKGIADVAAENIPRNKIVCFGINAPGNFIIGTYNGLYTFNSYSGKLTFITGGLQIRKIYCDKEGNAWICTSGKEFYCYTNNRLTVFRPDFKDNLFSYYELLEADNGYLWLSTSSGLIRAKKQNLLAYCKDKNVYVHYEFFGKSDGFLTKEFNGGGTNCAVKTGNGKLFFSSSKGLVSFYPAAIKNMHNYADVHIDDITVDSVHPASFKNFSLPPSFNKLSFFVSVPQFLSTSDNNIEYKVKGLSNTWEPLPEDGIIDFNKLPHADYVLYLRKGNSQNGYNYTESAFTVNAWFYQTLWFKILSALIVFFAVYFIIQLRLKLLREQRLRLEKTVELRTSELNQNIFVLQNTIKELEISEEKVYQNSKFKEKIISIILHDLRSPLRFISSVSNHLSAEHNTMPAATVKETLDSLSEESKNVYHFTNEFLTWIYSQQSDYTVNKAVIHLSSLFTDVRELYIKIAEQKNNLIEIKPVKISCVSDESILKIIVRNLVDNATKHISNSNIILNAFKAEEGIILSIADNGPGIPESVLEALQTDNISNGKSEKTLGLLLINELIKKLNGIVRFKSNHPSGTIAEIVLPD